MAKVTIDVPDDLWKVFDYHRENDFVSKMFCEALKEYINFPKPAIKTATMGILYEMPVLQIKKQEKKP